MNSNIMLPQNESPRYLEQIRFLFEWERAMIFGMAKKYLSILALSALLCSCKSTGHVDPGVLTRVSLGMTKQEVIKAVGNPESDAAEGNTETLFYVEERPWWQWARMQVKLVDGKVISYGEAPSK